MELSGLTPKKSINYQKQKSKMVSKRIGGFEISQLGSRMDIPQVDRMDIP